MEQLTPAQEARNARARRRQFIHERVKKYMDLATGGDELEITDELQKQAINEATESANKIFGTNEEINLNYGVEDYIKTEIKDDDADSLECPSCGRKKKKV